MSYRVTNTRRTGNEPRAYTWPALIVGIVLILAGIGIVVYWVNYWLSGNMPDGLWTLANNQYVVYHQAAEGVMAILAIAGGFGLLLGRGWGMATSLAALGALLYTGINSLSFSFTTAPALTPVFLGVLGFSLLGFIALHFSRRS